MVDTYNLPSYQKMNICIEETYYLIKKNNITSITLSEAVKDITEYFLLNNDIITAKDMKGIRKVLSENALLNENDVSSVSFIVKDDVTSGSVIRQCIQSFLISPEKNTDLLIKTINLCLDCDFIDLSNNLGELLIFIIDAYYSELYDTEALEVELAKWSENLGNKLSNALESDKDISILTKEYAENIFVQVQKAANYIKYNSIDNDSVITNIIVDIYEQLKAINSIVYSESNIKAIEFVNGDSVQPIPVSEAKIFERYSLIRALVNVGKYVDDKIESGVSSLKKKLSKAEDILWPEEKEKKDSKVVTTIKTTAKNVVNTANSLITGIVSKLKEATDNSVIFEFVGSDNKVDVTLYRIPLYEDDSQYITSISEQIDSLCCDLNKYLDTSGYTTLRCYYEIYPGFLSIHLKDATSLILSESDIEALEESRSKSENLNFYSDLLFFAESYSDIYEDIDIEDSLLNSIKENEEYSFELYDTLIEAASIIGVDKECIINYSNKYSNHQFNSFVLEGTQSQYQIEDKKIKVLVDNYEIYSEASMQDKLEALMILETILHEANIPNPNDKKKKDDNKDNDAGDEKKGNKLNLNTMKLYLQGLKTKFKDMSQKEKEISKKIDATSKVLVKSLKDSLISDRREAIIKGSVIPSFSKCMKIGIALAGIAKFGHPELAAIAALGGLIASKKLTKKERLLLLDDIEVELDVLEKEINNAESRGQMKKYRALLQQKKSLQRQYQRIKYNIRIGKDIMPNSEVGVKKVD